MHQCVTPGIFAGFPPRPKAMAVMLLASRVYTFFLGVVLLSRFSGVERSSLAFASNALLLYTLGSAVWLIPVALIGRRLDSWLTLAGCLGLTSLLWGGLFIPKQSQGSAPGPSVSVMAYNVLGYNFDTASTLRILREAAPDVAVLQELNPENSAAIERELSSRYPYRWLDAQPGVRGGGIVSRFPFREISAGPLAGVPWVGKPMVITFSVGSRELTLVRVHSYSGPGNVAERNDEAAAITAFASAHQGPLVVVGDFNATDQNGTYHLITSVLRDSWREAGYGLGHTFPGTPTNPGSRPVILGIKAPMWLVRIDYVFHSPDLFAKTAQIIASDGASDHRPVMATLGFR